MHLDFFAQNDDMVPSVTFRPPRERALGNTESREEGKAHPYAVSGDSTGA